MNLVLPRKSTFSLIHVPIYCSLVATIAVVQCDSDGDDEDARNGVRRVAWPGGYYASKLPPPIPNRDHGWLTMEDA